ncbi:MAG: hypothetical protein ACFE95_08030 [Candidatus Hodarchaeota archaeon]
MPRILNVKLNGFLVFLIATILMFPLLTTADPIPIIFIEEDRETYSPVTYGDWDYYILPPGTDYFPDYFSALLAPIEYWGTNAPGHYTTNTGGEFDYSTFSLTRGEELPWWDPDYTPFVRNDSRSNDAHLFFDAIPLPRAVRIASTEKPAFTRVQKQPLSLHMDYASTFLAEEDVLYWGFLNSSEPFFIDVSLSGKAVEANLMIDETFPGYYLTGVPETKMTYPVFPLNASTSIRRFYLMPNVTTVVTLTPHPWEFPDWLPILEPNTVFTGELEQGETWYLDAETDRMIKPDNEMFSIRMFNLSLVEGEYYRIATVFDMEDVKPGVPSAVPEIFLMGEHYKPILGSFKLDGYMDIYAQESENVTLVLYSPGEAHGQYFIAFQEKAAPVILTEERPLTLNTNITVEESINYTFTLPTPKMMRVNWTSGANFFYDIYVEGSEPGKWILKEDEGFFPDIDAWRYLPAGKYAIVFTGIPITGEIQFNTVEIQNPTASPFNVENDTILAIELPLTRNRINFVNISTADQVNQTIYYDYVIVSKYNEFIDDEDTGIELGNRQTATGWEAFPNNNTVLELYFPTRDYEEPILIIYPSPTQIAQNTTELPSSDLTGGFSATLTVTTNEALNQSLLDIDAFIPEAYLYFDDDTDQYFIPWSAISTTTNINVNDDYSDDDDHLYGIPLNLDPYSIYNITVYLIGNHSIYDPGNPSFDEPDEFLNATFEATQFFVHGGNLRSLEIFNTDSEDFGNTSIWRTSLILTVSSTSYLYVDTERWGSRNATLQVVITKLSVTNMEFLIEYEYNHTIGEQEVFTEGLLADEIKPSEMLEPTARFPVELLLIAGGVVAGGGAIAAAVIFIRRRRSI